MISYDHDSRIFRASWIALALTAAGELVFGLVLALLPGQDAATRSLAAGAVGMGLFALALVLGPFRRRERRAWWALWYLPIFWTWHLLAGLPPGKDHVHQYVFIALSLFGLLAPARTFFGIRGR